MRHLLFAALLALLPASALANNAFPDELEVFAPADTGLVVLGTNYGVIHSDDAVHWTWVCEPAVTTAAVVGAYGVGSDGGLWALAGTKPLVSNDLGCTWAGVVPATGVDTVSDIFVDPGDPQHALVIGVSTLSGNFAIYATLDRGQSWTGPVLSANQQGELLGVEISRSNPARAFATEYAFATHAVALFRSDDHGQTWTELDHPELGDAYPFLAAIDPVDPDTVWLRLVPNSASGGDQLAVSHDKGATFTVAFTAPSTLSALAVGEDHTVWTASRANDLWRLDPDAGSFVHLPGPSVRCMAERAGTLYACGDATADGGFVLGASIDRGQSFTALVKPTTYQTAACAVAEGACAPVNVIPDAGSPTDAGGSSTGSTGSPPPSKGCGCGEADASSLAGLLLALAFLRQRSMRQSQ
ncbi:MAG: hypothetical protein JST54_33075 [Deltaproteobacteria bacterium]|nr:hypothetical protein [Deltaproteobacteria bacterium]